MGKKRMGLEQKVSNHGGKNGQKLEVGMAETKVGSIVQDVAMKNGMRAGMEKEVVGRRLAIKVESSMVETLPTRKLDGGKMKLVKAGRKMKQASTKAMKRRRKAMKRRRSGKETIQVKKAGDAVGCGTSRGSQSS